MKMNQMLILAGIVGALCFGATNVLAQAGQGGANFNFDAAQIQKLLLNNYREQLEVTDDAEWKLIEERIQKVVDARRDVGFGGMGMGMLGRMGRGRGGNAPEGAGAVRRGLGAFAPAPMPEEEALQKAIDAKAPSTELKAALAKYVEARKQRQAKLEQAQAELRQVLSLRQEAIASIAGLL
jgi:hypothetical protein